MKAKWVRIELRKVETLPGGGLANTFFDFVGQSPVNLWQSGDEYSTLSTVRSQVIPGLFDRLSFPQQDFPFSIRIPESIPPSIALEKGGMSLSHVPSLRSFTHYRSRNQVRTHCYALHQGKEASFVVTLYANTC